MSLTYSEQATLNFYEWDYRYRGYYHFESPIDIEPPYRSFQFPVQKSNSKIDDGRVPSLFQSIGKLLSPPQKEEPQEIEELEPRFLAPENAPVVATAAPAVGALVPNFDVLEDALDTLRQDDAAAETRVVQRRSRALRARASCRVNALPVVRGVRDSHVLTAHLEALFHDLWHSTLCCAVEHPRALHAGTRLGLQTRLARQELLEKRWVVPVLHRGGAPLATAAIRTVAKKRRGSNISRFRSISNLNFDHF